MPEVQALVARPLTRAAIAERSTRGDDARVCAAIVRTHARTFSAASRLLPARKRRAVYALYAFCRVADDLVDHTDGGSPADVAARLDALEQQLVNALAGTPEGPVFRELIAAVHQFRVPERALRELLDGVARDLRPARYETWSELAAYCGGVASSVGEMCTAVFGVQGDAKTERQAVRYARTLGVAMQLTNILRDVGEDARRGRCYLPLEDLAAFGLTADEVLSRRDLARDERWRPLMAFEIGRARALYEAAMPGIALLAPDAGRCAAACATGYAAILDAIEANGYDTIGTRARLGRTARLALLWRAWRGAPPAVTTGAGPHVELHAVKLA
jgi:phytoene synthase